MNEKHLLGQHIRQLRKARNMSLKQLAGEAGCSESMLSKVENGKGNPSLNILHRIAKALGANMGSLFSPEAGDGVVQRKGARHLAQLTVGARGQGIILEYLTARPRPDTGCTAHTPHRRRPAAAPRATSATRARRPATCSRASWS